MKLNCRGLLILRMSLVMVTSLTLPARAERAVMTLLPSNVFSANDMSPDGRYVVGRLKTSDSYLWDTVSDTWTILAGNGGFAASVSDDGTTVVGSMNSPVPGEQDVAGIWTTSNPVWTSIGHLPGTAMACGGQSNAYEVSADGSVVVGLSFYDGCKAAGFHWTEATGMVPLESLANGGNRASVISADGTVIAGFAQGSFSRTPAIWDGTTLTGELLDPPNGDALGEITGIRDDGSVLLGVWNGDATRWTNDGGTWVRERIGNGSSPPPSRVIRSTSRTRIASWVLTRCSGTAWPGCMTMAMRMLPCSRILSGRGAVKFRSFPRMIPTTLNSHGAPPSSPSIQPPFRQTVT